MTKERIKYTMIAITLIQCVVVTPGYNQNQYTFKHYLLNLSGYVCGNTGSIYTSESEQNILCQARKVSTINMGTSMIESDSFLHWSSTSIQVEDTFLISAGKNIDFVYKRNNGFIPLSYQSVIISHPNDNGFIIKGNDRNLIGTHDYHYVQP